MTFLKTLWVERSVPKLSADQLNRMEQGIADAHSGAAVPFVTALPGPATDGQEVNFIADADKGVVWRLKYRAADPSAYKWQFIGGGDLMDYAGATYTQPNAGSGLPASDPPDGPTLTIPLAGEYKVEWGLKNDGSPSGSLFAYLAYNGVGAPALVGSNYLDWWTEPPNDFSNFLSRRGKFTLSPASKALTVRYAHSAANGKFAERTLFARPVRVG